MIERIKAKDFLSWEELDVTIPAGVTLIEGFNFDDNTPEGCGKSALLNAAAWGLYGKLPKEANVDEVIRHAAKSCVVEVFLPGDAKVVRSRKPNGLYLEIGDQRIRGKDARETQQKIVEHLGMSFETFCQTMYFAQNYPNKFITANENDRAKVFSEIVDLSIFDEARKRAHEKVKDVELEWTKLKAKIEYLPPMLEQADSTLRSFKELRKDCLTRYESERDDLKADIAQDLEDLTECKNKLEALAPKVKRAKKIITEGEELTAELGERSTILRERIAVIKSSGKNRTFLERQVEKAREQLKMRKRDVEELEEALDALKPKMDICDTCGNALTPEQQKKAFKQEQKALQEDIECVNGEVRTDKEDLADFKAQLKEVGNIAELAPTQAKLTDVEESMSEKEQQLDKFHDILDKQEALQGDLEQIQKVLNTWGTKLEAHKNLKPWVKYDKKIKDAKMDRQELLDKQNRLKAQEVKLRDEVAQFTTLKSGFREVKSYVFRGVLAELSARANEYVTQLFEVPIHIRFHNEGKDGEISKILVDVEMNGITQSLGLYSGGQFRRICLGVDLALSDLIATRSGKVSNLLILDEYFKDLSEVSMEKILELLQNTGKSIILIEHNSIFKNIVQNSLHIEYRNKVSNFV